MNKNRVVISGVGTVSPYGFGVENYWNGLITGKTAARMIEEFDVSRLPTKFAANVPISDSELNERIVNQKSIKTLSRAMKFAIIAADEAIHDAGLTVENLDPMRFGVSLGAGGLGLWDLEYSNQMLQIVRDSVLNSANLKLDLGEVYKNLLDKVNPLTPLKALPNMAAAHIAINYNARGHCQTITTACTSSTQAIGEAFRLIRSNFADIVITGGSDSMINPNGLVAFCTLGVISKNNSEYTTAARPFDKRRDGFMIGEGGAILILEKLDHCLERGRQPYAEIIGYASTCDAFRLTDEPDQAWSAIEAMKLALAQAQMEPEQVEYINAHGTGTQMNDKNETFAIKQLFGKYAYSIPVNSSKSLIGHQVATAGAFELLACILSLKNQLIHPTINYVEPDPECDLDYVPNKSRAYQFGTALSNSFGFGGQNACLLIKSID